MTIEVLSDNSVEVSVVATPAVEVEVSPGGFTQQVVSVNPEYTIAVGVIENDPTIFKEYAYTSGDLTQISTWDSPAKGTLLMQKVLAYSGGNLSTIQTTYSGITLQTTYTFTDGNLVSTDTVRL